MKIEEILRTKGHEVVTITEAQSVLEAARLLVERNIGGLVVTDGRRLRGIITERDVLRLAGEASADLSSISVGSVMTRDVITASLNDGLVEMMDIMTERRIRHLPVMEDERLAGIISIGDLVNACRLSAERENSQLREYIQGVG